MACRVERRFVAGASRVTKVCVTAPCALVVPQTVIYPIDVVRLRITTTPGVYAGLADGMTSMVKAEGTGSLFKAGSSDDVAYQGLTS